MISMKKQPLHDIPRIFRLFLLLPVLFSGCGGGDTATPAQAGLPKPGTMRLVSVAPVVTQKAMAGGGNLLAGGGFKSWWAGAPAPQGILAPDAAVSRLERNKGGGGGVVQVWAKAEDAGAAAQCMRAETAAVAPGVYRLEAAAENTGGGGITLGVWLREGDTLRPVAEDLIHLLPGGGTVKRYAAEFTLKEKGAVVVASRALPGAREGAAALWRYWRLTREGGA